MILPSSNGGWWRWALVSPDGVAPSQMVCVSVSVNLPLHHKVQKFSSGTSSPGGPGKRAVKQLCVCVCPHPADMALNSLLCADKGKGFPILDTKHWARS